MKIVVPIKGIHNAKQRLSAVLSNAERSELMRHMIDDVLGAAQQSVQIAQGKISGLIVVTDDAQVTEQAAAYNAQIVAEPAERTGLGDEALCAAVNAAANLLAAEGENGLLMVPADVPLVTAKTLNQLAARHHENNPCVTLVAARSDGGTNALILSPPHVIPAMFGNNSYQRHSRWAQANNIQLLLPKIPELSLDIDTVSDLQALMMEPIRCQTQRYLLSSGIAEKIQYLAENQSGRAAS